MATIRKGSTKDLMDDKDIEVMDTHEEGAQTEGEHLRELCTLKNDDVLSVSDLILNSSSFRSRSWDGGHADWSGKGRRDGYWSAA